MSPSSDKKKKYLLCPPPHLLRDPTTYRFVSRFGKRAQELQQLFPKLEDMQCVRASRTPPHAAQVPISFVRQRDRKHYIERRGEFVEWDRNVSIPYFRDDQNAQLRSRMGRLYGPKILRFLPPQYRITELGHGSYGYVYLLCNALTNECSEVVKIQRKPSRMPLREFMTNVKREIGMQRVFSKHQLSPRILDSMFFEYGDKHFSAIRMEKIDAILEHTIKNIRGGMRTDVFIYSLMDAIDDMVQYMCKHSLIHGDFHVGNLGYRTVLDPTEPGRYHWDLIMIDFGWASKGLASFQCHPELEWIQFLRSLLIMRERRHYVNRAFLNKMIDVVYEHFRTSYPQYKVAKTLDSVDAMFDELHRFYRDQHFNIVSM